MVAMVIDAIGVRLTATAVDMRGQIRAGKFFWLDIFGGGNLERAELLGELGLDSADITWALRFGQAGRMYIGRSGCAPSPGLPTRPATFTRCTCSPARTAF